MIQPRALGAILASFAIAGVALAHSNLMQSVPADGQTIASLTKTVTLEFSEPLEVKFSVFKVYRLQTNPTDANAARKDAEALMDEVLDKKGDESARADDGLATDVPSAARLQVKLKPRLQPGWYVVMWRALSVDTHTTDDWLVFRYKPN